MKVALIGANGQLGTDIARTSPDKVELFPLTRKDFDITNKDKMDEILTKIKPNAIINTAAFHKTEECEDKENLAFEVNTIAVKHLSEISESIKAKLVHISTDYVFDGNKLKEKVPYFESDRPNPINVYGLSKFSGEIMVKNYTDNYLIVRISSVFGKSGASGKGGNFVFTMLNLAKKKPELKVINDIYMSPTYTLDAAKQIWKLIIEEASGIYHSANEGICTWFEFAKEIISLAGLKAKVIPVDHTFYPSKAKRPLWSPIASEKGIKLKYWKDALRRFLKEIGATS